MEKRKKIKNGLVPPKKIVWWLITSMTMLILAIFFTRDTELFGALWWFASWFFGIIILLIITLAVLIKLRGGEEDENDEEDGSSKKTRLDEKAKARKQKVFDGLRIFSPLIVWLTLIVTALIFGSTGYWTEPWGFLWETNRVATLTTFALLFIWSTLRFYSKKNDGESSKGGDKNDSTDKLVYMAALVVAVLILIVWGRAVYRIDWKESAEDKRVQSDTQSRQVVSQKEFVHKTLSEFTASQDEWTAPYYPPTDEESGGGFYIYFTGPVRIRTTYLDKVTEMIRKPGDKDGVGKAEKLEFRAIGNEPVRVKITIKVRER